MLCYPFGSEARAGDCADACRRDAENAFPLCAAGDFLQVRTVAGPEPEHYVEVERGNVYGSGSNQAPEATRGRALEVACATALSKAESACRKKPPETGHRDWVHGRSSRVAYSDRCTEQVGGIYEGFSCSCRVESKCRERIVNPSHVEWQQRKRQEGDESREARAKASETEACERRRRRDVDARARECAGSCADDDRSSAGGGASGHEGSETPGDPSSDDDLADEARRDEAQMEGDERDAARGDRAAGGGQANDEPRPGTSLPRTESRAERRARAGARFLANLPREPCARAEALASVNAADPTFFRRLAIRPESIPESESRCTQARVNRLYRSVGGFDIDVVPLRFNTEDTAAIFAGVGVFGGVLGITFLIEGGVEGTLAEPGPPPPTRRAVSPRFWLRVPRRATRVAITSLSVAGFGVELARLVSSNPKPSRPTPLRALLGTTPAWGYPTLTSGLTFAYTSYEGDPERGGHVGGGTSVTGRFWAFRLGVDTFLRAGYAEEPDPFRYEVPLRVGVQAPSNGLLAPFAEVQFELFPHWPDADPVDVSVAGSPMPRFRFGNTFHFHPFSQGRLGGSSLSGFVEVAVTTPALPGGSPTFGLTFGVADVFGLVNLAEFDRGFHRGGDWDPRFSAVEAGVPPEDPIIAVSTDSRSGRSSEAGIERLNPLRFEAAYGRFETIGGAAAQGSPRAREGVRARLRVVPTAAEGLSLHPRFELGGSVSSSGSGEWIPHAPRVPLWEAGGFVGGGALVPVSGDGRAMELEVGARGGAWVRWAKEGEVPAAADRIAGLVDLVVGLDVAFLGSMGPVLRVGPVVDLEFGGLLDAVPTQTFRRLRARADPDWRVGTDYGSRRFDARLGARMVLPHLAPVRLVVEVGVGVEARRPGHGDDGSQPAWGAGPFLRIGGEVAASRR